MDASQNGAYVPAPSIGHELGILFGFLGANIIGALLFYAWWVWKMKREEREEKAHLDKLLEARHRSGREMESSGHKPPLRQQTITSIGGHNANGGEYLGAAGSARDFMPVVRDQREGGLPHIDDYA